MTGIQLLVFITFQIIFFRFINVRRVIAWISKSFIISAVFVNFIFLFFLPVGDASIWLTVLIALIIYSILAQLYIYGIFGIAESSIRIRVLNEIVNAMPSGLTYNQILNVYNKEIILDKRLMRFLNSGELILKKNKYKLSGKVSLSFIPAAIFSFYWKIYR